MAKAWRLRRVRERDKAEPVDGDGGNESRVFCGQRETAIDGGTSRCSRRAMKTSKTPTTIYIAAGSSTDVPTSSPSPGSHIRHRRQDRHDGQALSNA
jgi:hypothetical protein